MLEFNATFLVSMISFIVFIIIMNAIFYKPILGVIEERENFINDHYNDAKNSKDKAQSLLEQKEKRLNDTLSESKKIQTKLMKQTKKQNQLLMMQKLILQIKFSLLKKSFMKKKFKPQKN